MSDQQSNFISDLLFVVSKDFLLELKHVSESELSNRDKSHELRSMGSLIGREIQILSCDASSADQRLFGLTCSDFSGDNCTVGDSSCEEENFKEIEGENSSIPITIDEAIQLYSDYTHRKRVSEKAARDSNIILIGNDDTRNYLNSYWKQRKQVVDAIK